MRSCLCPRTLGENQNLEGEPLPPVTSLQHHLPTKLNTLPTGKGKACEGLISIFTEQVMKDQFRAEKQSINNWHQVVPIGRSFHSGCENTKHSCPWLSPEDCLLLFHGFFPTCTQLTTWGECSSRLSSILPRELPTRPPQTSHFLSPTNEVTGLSLETLFRQQSWAITALTLFPFSQRSLFCSACCPTSDYRYFVSSVLSFSLFNAEGTGQSLLLHHGQNQKLACDFGRDFSCRHDFAFQKALTGSSSVSEPFLAAVTSTNTPVCHIL